jgi:uncharacterized protein DUF4384
MLLAIEKIIRMRPILKTILVAFCINLVILCATAQSQEGASRQIVLEEFIRARPAKPAETLAGVSNSKARSRTRASSAINRLKRATYRRASGMALLSSAYSKRTSARPAGSEELGLTLWRLRPSRQNDSGARLLVMESSQTGQWTPERIEADTPLKIGERVRISVESPRAGYLYVVDREQYADGSLGDAYLIFPTTRTHNGDNKVRPGKLIDIPAQEDAPNYFTLVPSPSRSDQVAEVLSFMVTSKPLENLPLTDKPLKVSKSDIAKWEKSWSSEVERLEMNGGAGQAWTNEEKAASATSSSRLLTQEEPSPQTVYRIAAKASGSLLVTVPLRYGNSKP